ncbi:MAG: anti-sigma factor [Sphingomonas sp.]|nr:anti-sigma factor [Sphingomonas sp.]
MAIDDSKFFAWLDGELDSAEAAEVEAEVAADPRLARMAEQHRAFETRVREAFDTVAGEPVPDRLAQAARPSGAEIVDFGARSRARNGRGSWLPVPQWAAIAATLALGIGLGTMLDGERGASPVEIRGGKMYAAAALDDSLERQLASAGEAGSVRIGLTFRDQAGTICRSFSDQRSSGFACRDGSDWRLRGLFAAPEGQGGDYRMAAGPDPNLAVLIDSAIAGEPFDAEQERAAKARGWR